MTCRAASMVPGACPMPTGILAWPLLAGANSPELRTVGRGIGELGWTTLQSV